VGNGEDEGYGAEDAHATGGDGDESLEPFGALREGPDGASGSDDEDMDLPDEALPTEEQFHTGLPPRMEAWRQRSATGAILTGFALGLQQALEPKRDEPSIVIQTSGDPPQDLPVEADFEYRRPRQSVVNIRPWLLDEVSDAPITEPRRADEEPKEPDDRRPGGPVEP
jgi:hypothetical protein